MREFTTTLRQRELTTQFADMTAFFGDRLDASAGTKTFSDKTGNCRLPWFDWMMRHPVESVGFADEYTRALHAAAGRNTGAPSGVVTLATPKLDDRVPRTQLPPRPLVAVSDPGLRELIRTITLVHQLHTQALAPLTPTEREELIATLYPQTTGNAQAPRFADPTGGRRVCDLLEKLDRLPLLQAAEALAHLSDARSLRQLRRTAARYARGNAPVAIKTPAGMVMFGGAGADTYHLDEHPDICAVIDIDGDDTYIEGSVSTDRPVLVILDLGGNDRYEGQTPGIQGAAILGASLLVDTAGDDVYRAGNVAQGSALAGVGLLLDQAGHDQYFGDKRVQGQAVCGLGVLLDRAGDDKYRAALLGQGVGGPLGFGLLDDGSGNDHYYAGGKYPDNYDDTPGYNGWSQGVGVGPRGTANGGIGVLLDGGGDDIYEADYFSHGGGYWFALGFARDFGGDDQRLGSTRTAWDGRERTEKRFLRYGNSFGVHYAAGYLFDDAGNDHYFTDFAGTGFTWDVGITALIDSDGDDRYEAGSGVCACFNAGLMLLLDRRGNDTYVSGNAGLAADKSDYHPQDARSYNFTFLLDLQGQDSYPAEIRNNAETVRGWAGGLVIDR